MRFKQPPAGASDSEMIATNTGQWVAEAGRIFLSGYGRVRLQKIRPVIACQMRQETKGNQGHLRMINEARPENVALIGAILDGGSGCDRL
ncbi:hypothetical protein [Nonomuraea sp. CA-141351]|uniref:hypothetical protein n=1 Tax=Nonomuraea sp. CA-141351 TaxID=3239996 RepID=UPI003D8C1631